MSSWKEGEQPTAQTSTNPDALGGLRDHHQGDSNLELNLQGDSELTTAQGMDSHKWSFSIFSRFESDPITRWLFCLQQNIHYKHGRMDKAVNATIDGIDRLNSVAERMFSWLEHDTPQLILPAAQTALVGWTTNFANRHRSTPLRYFSVAAMTMVASLLIFPSWRSLVARFSQDRLAKTIPGWPEQYGRLQSLHSRAVDGLVEVWDFYDAMINHSRPY